MFFRVQVSAVLIIALGFVASAHAQSYRLLEGQLQVTQPSWGQHCGQPPPSSKAKPGALYTLIAGDNLKPTGSAPNLFGPNICEQATGLPWLEGQRKGTQIQCVSPKNASTQAAGTVTMRRNRNRLIIRHTFEYEWRLHGSHCQLRTVGVWQLDAIQPKPAPAVAAKVRCQSIGRPHRLEPITPTNVKVAPKGRVRLRAKVVDKAGCKVRKRIRWSTKGGRINRKGFFRPTKTRLGRTATVIARSGKLRLRFNVEVTNEANLAKWMPARPSIAPQTKIAVPETSEIMGIKVTARHPASKQADSIVNRLDRGPLILAILGFLLLSAGLILVRRKTIN